MLLLDGVNDGCNAVIDDDLYCGHFAQKSAVLRTVFILKQNGSKKHLEIKHNL